jgi:hypothetical protein
MRSRSRPARRRIGRASARPTRQPVARRRRRVTSSNPRASQREAHGASPMPRSIAFMSFS